MPTEQESLDAIHRALDAAPKRTRHPAVVERVLHIQSEGDLLELIVRGLHWCGHQYHCGGGGTGCEVVVGLRSLPMLEDDPEPNAMQAVLEPSEVYAFVAALAQAALSTGADDY